MGQIIAVFLQVMVMLLVPLGILQVHTVIQTHNELLEVSAAATKYVSNHGGRGEGEVLGKVRAFISQELAEKSFSLSEDDLVVKVERSRAADPVLWSHEDEFMLEAELPFPLFTSWFSSSEKKMRVTRYGTINRMDYDL
ncbi:hypothetical protein NDK47_01130 [Brevibacillus ruminantium]|uniref:Pilus assembly protein TadE n=1 Tax=Brevibacillus ruminantium TaxID=2950604 RepID=A0ABY4WFQ9_9BACL|nr:hypothetical protein [Brevibacillus ruminantium]USG65991.1 hypothetical protein NDK47_01130 [Brevibacillus ruminantium]